MQVCLRKRIILEDCLSEKIQLVAGVDTAYTMDTAISVATVLDYESLKIVEMKTAIRPANFPYIPNLFAFREFPSSFACIQKLTSKPDVFLVDGHGIAHPRRCGLASHLGLAIRKPTIGIAKNRLFGKTGSVDGKVVLVDNGEVIGEVIERKDCAPIYVSIGNMISLETASKIVNHVTKNHRIPEPLQIAHQEATLQRNRLLNI